MSRYNNCYEAEVIVTLKIKQQFGARSLASANSTIDTMIENDEIDFFDPQNAEVTSVEVNSVEEIDKPDAWDYNE